MIMQRILYSVILIGISLSVYSQDSQVEKELKQADKLLIEKKYDEAMEYVETALEIDPFNLEALEKKVNINILKENSKELFKEIDELIKNYPTQPEYYYVRALLFLYKQKQQKAIEDFESAIDNNIPVEYMEKIYLNRGMAYYNIGNFPMAEENFENALKLNPEYSTVYHSWGMLKYEVKEYDAAVKNFKKAILYEDDNPIIYYNLGMSYLRLKDMDNACKYFNISSTLGYKNAFKVYFLECTE